MRLWFICLFAIKIVVIDATVKTPTPVILWHGMGDTCCVSFSMGAIKMLIEQSIPGIYVSSLKIGNNTIEDLESGYFMNPNEQVDFVCKILLTNDKLKNGFNVMGFSQGSQFFRAVVQRCGHNLPPIKNLISIGGQHQGVYGLPHCYALERKSCDYVREVLNYAAYAKWVQRSLVQATYWHDSLNEKLYRENSIFLSDINNEVNVNKTYIDNLNRLEHFVMVKFNNDTIVQPRETEWFEFYGEGQAKKIQPLRESRIYTEDRLGLKQMDKAGKLVFISKDGDHLHMSSEWLVQNIITPYLNQTI